MSKTEISAREMSDLLIARVRERRNMRDKMPGDVNATLTVELAALVCSLNEIVAETIGAAELAGQSVK